MGVMGYSKEKDGSCPFCGSKKYVPVCSRCHNQLEQEELEECKECGAIVFKKVYDS